MSSNELVVAKKAVASFSTGKQVNQDAWMTYVSFMSPFRDLLTYIFLVVCGVILIGVTSYNLPLCPLLSLGPSLSLLHPQMISVRGMFVLQAVRTIEGPCSSALLTERNPNDTGPAVKWEFAKYPDSFKSCLQQMYVLKAVKICSLFAGILQHFI